MSACEDVICVVSAYDEVFRRRRHVDSMDVYAPAGLGSGPRRVVGSRFAFPVRSERIRLRRSGVSIELPVSSKQFFFK